MRKWNWWLELYFMGVDDEGVRERDGSEAFCGISNTRFFAVFGFVF